MGTWLGSSSVHLAQGLRDSGYPGKLHCYDRFIWQGKIHNHKSGLELEKGADFRPYFEENVEPFKDIIETTTADFRKIRWSGEPIEILFLDAPKTSGGFHATFNAFAKYLMPGESIVAFQDYLHAPSYDLALCIQHLGDKLELRHVVHNGGTVSFQVMGKIEPSDYDIEDLKFRRMNKDQIFEAWERILSPLPDVTRERFATGKAMHLCDIGQVDEACAVLAGLDIDEYMQSKWRAWRMQEPMVEKYGPLIDVAIPTLA